MIVTESAGRYRFVTQPDHGALSGRLARHWGNDTFARPARRHSVLVAAEAHDQGWVDYDLRPRFEDGGPVDFTQVPDEDWHDFYADGVETVADLDAYAGLLTSMHAAGLRCSGYGARPAIPDRLDEPRCAGFVARQEAHQKKLADDLDLDDGDRAVLADLHERKETDETSPLWRNYLRLQAFDALSLYACTASTFGGDEIGPVPVDDDRTETLSLDPIGPAAVRVDPWPFDSDVVALPVRRRVVPSDADDPVEAYYAADVETVTYTLHA
ncbi:DUF3891 family protein [Halocalculus aciditolerans]|uniref:DUF3891 family protein n=1 Tax=Halocalculus aciditolerans TaxID=1383812 RepID=A0A830F073_9EURY|nr:DUF3891 family protein [Halocalculus aciditolerans]GGL49927.1 hypothetical protein GCM10009039_05090 [Halocalculus aciditolerans]